jgi:hypothetical protein
MTTPSFEKREALKNLDAFFEKEKRAVLSPSEIEQVQDTAKYIWSQLEAKKKKSASFDDSPPHLFPVGAVDAAFTRGSTTYVFTGDQYYAFTDNYETPDDGYPRPIVSNTDGLPMVDRIDTVLRGPDGKLYFFHNDRRSFSQSGDLRTHYPTAGRWGIGQRSSIGTTGIVDAALTINDRIYLFSGDEYVRFTSSNGQISNHPDPGYPKLIRTNTEGFPQQHRIDAALRGPDGKLYFFHNDRRSFSQSGDLRIHIPTAGRWDMERRSNIGTSGIVDAALTINDRIYLFSGDEYVRFTAYNGQIGQHPDPGYPKLIRTNTEGFPQQHRIDAALQAPDGELYFFHNDRRVFSSSDQLQVFNNTGDRWGNGEKSSIGTSGIIDAALTVNDKVYLFSGDEYFRYTTLQGNIGQHPDPGYPKSIRTNTEGFPQQDRIDAAFVGFDGKLYFFNKADQTFVSSDDLTKPRSTRIDIGITQVPAPMPEGELLGAALLFDNFTYLLTDTDFIKYPNGDDGFIDLFLDHRFKQHFQIHESRIEKQLKKIDDTLLKMALPDLNLGLLHLADSRIKGKGDGRISETDAAALVAYAQAGEKSSIDKLEFRTIAYILARYNVTAGAKAVLLKAIQ